MVHVRQLLRRKKALLPLISIVSAASTWFSWGYQNARKIQRDYLTVSSPKLKNDYNIIFISDLHYGKYNAEAVEDMLQELSNEDISMVILGGDIVDANTPPVMAEYILRRIAGLPNVEEGVFWVYGNNDRKNTALSSYVEDGVCHELLRDLNITVLSECRCTVAPDLAITGREDFFAEYKHPRNISMLRLGNEKECFNILVDHAPKEMKTIAHYGYDMMLSGHTHDGQFALFRAAMKFVGCEAAGYKTVGNTRVLMSPGAGVQQKFETRMRTANKCMYHKIHLIPEGTLC